MARLKTATDMQESFDFSIYLRYGRHYVLKLMVRNMAIDSITVALVSGQEGARWAAVVRSKNGKPPGKVVGLAEWVGTTRLAVDSGSCGLGVNHAASDPTLTVAGHMDPVLARRGVVSS